MAVCSVCGKKIKDGNAHYINGVPYGYNCYKQKLALIYKEWEDERNKEYSIKCFSVMQIFITKKSNSFHDSIIKQWNDCKKLTMKQLNCIIDGFSKNEIIEFYKVWFMLTEDNETKKHISNFTIYIINTMKENNGGSESAWGQFIEDELIHNIIKFDAIGNSYRYGFYFNNDIDDPEFIFISPIKKDRRGLNEAIEDEYINIIKIIE